MTSTTAPLLTILRSTQLRAVRPSKSLNQLASTSITRPLSTALARVCLVSISSSYSRNATMKMSTMSVTVGRLNTFHKTVLTWSQNVCTRGTHFPGFLAIFIILHGIRQENPMAEISSGTGCIRIRAPTNMV